MMLQSRRVVIMPQRKYNSIDPVLIIMGTLMEKKAKDDEGKDPAMPRL